MMNVLYLARYRHSSMERKLALMATEPDVTLRLVRPSVWKGSYGPRHLPIVNDTLYSTSAVSLLGKHTDHHRVMYQTLDFGLSAMKPDLIHAEEEPDSLAALQIALARQLFAPRSLLILHTWQNINRPKSWYVEEITQFSLRQADAVLCASSEARQVVREMGFRGDTETVLQEGVNTEVFFPPETPPSIDPFTVVYAGRLAPEKGVDTLISAMSSLPATVRLRIIGEGPCRLELESMVSAFDIEERVDFAGSVTLDRMAEMLRQSNVLVLPSRTTTKWKEQFGRVLVEAMATKLPVVGSDSGAIPEVIGDAGLVFPEGDVATLERCLAQLMTSPDLCRSLGESGHKRVRCLYSQKRIAEATVGFYRRLVG